MSCPKCGWRMGSFNCGTMAFGEKCENLDCSYEVRPTNPYDTIKRLHKTIRRLRKELRTKDEV